MGSMVTLESLHPLVSPVLCSGVTEQGCQYTLNTINPLASAFNHFISTADSHESPQPETCLWHWPPPSLQWGHGQPSFSPPTDFCHQMRAYHSQQVWGLVCCSRGPSWRDMAGKVLAHPGNSYITVWCHQRGEQKTPLDLGWPVAFRETENVTVDVCIFTSI